MKRDHGDRRRISNREGGEGGVSVWIYLLSFYLQTKPSVPCVREPSSLKVCVKSRRQPFW